MKKYISIVLSLIFLSGCSAVLEIPERTNVIEIVQNKEVREIEKQQEDWTIKVEGGTFHMVDPRGNSNGNVTLSTFYMGKYEVTQKEFESIMGFNPSRSLGINNPVEQVTWFDAVMYCNKLSEKKGLSPYYSISNIRKRGDSIESATVNIIGGKGYRLPTEAEWEYAAKGGNKSKGYTYAGSNNIDEVAWYIDNSGNKTHPVGTKKPNELGLYDMTGNVWEWCWDAFRIYNNEDKINPTGPDNISRPSRVKRGGSYCDTYNIRISMNLIISFRDRINPISRGINRGFRVVRSE